MESKTRIFIRRRLKQPFTVRVSARHLPATYNDATHVELRTTLPRPVKTFLTGYGVRCAEDGEAELLGSLRVSIRDIVSDHPPLSDDDAAAVREMTAEARAIAAAVGLLPEGAA